MTRKNVQPYRKPHKGPYASRRKTYWPPALGVIAASSAQERAPAIVKKPPKTQRPISSPGCGTFWAMIDGAMKMPEPIIEPTISVVASNQPRRGGKACSEDCVAMVSIEAGAVDAVHRLQGRDAHGRRLSNQSL